MKIDAQKKIGNSLCNSGISSKNQKPKNVTPAMTNSNPAKTLVAFITCCNRILNNEP